jgi:integrase/recombinase XerD
MRSVLLLLYGTGLRVREAIALNRTDVDRVNSVITVRQTKFFKTRLVPFGRPVGEILARYAAQPRPASAVPSAETPFFTTRAGARLNQDTFTHIFRRLCEQSGLRRHDGARYQPRLHDLRHTFAVHRLTSWYQQGADVQQLLPQLSVYLGHTNLAATQIYLSMTPELLHQASLRFEHYAVQELNHE